MNKTLEEEGGEWLCENYNEELAECDHINFNNSIKRKMRIIVR